MKPTVPLRVFALAMMWTILSAMLPVGVVLWRWISLWQDPPDMRILGPLSITCAAQGALAFWRKHKALLQLPPYLEAARDLVRETTIETVEKSIDRNAATSTTTTTTVKETALVKPEAPPEPPV